MRVVDSHFHWFPRSHFETMAARSSYPRTERVGDGYKYRYHDGRGFIPLPAIWFDLDLGLETAATATGPDTVVVCTTGVLAGMLDQMPAEEALDEAYAYNEEIAKAQRSHTGRFFGTAAVPLQDTDSALAVLDHAVRSLDLRGVNLPSMIGDETVDQERLEPFFARVAELGVPLVIHPTDLAFNEVLTGYADGLQRSLGRLLDSSVTVLRLIFSGVLERHPSLRVVQTHGGGLLPYQAGRIDKNARIEGLPSLPSHYLRRTFVDTVAPQALTIRTALEYYGADHILYGTDHPCWSPRAAVSVLDEAGLSDEVRVKIYSNAASVFPLD
ncbi:amidohydrolase family protein [Amycolatopsis sp. FDAARGOS 1241]|uniref:amidohydrolase family protein n=1 Tax=Amycolatopsis sp. FDAARGOS 1241 TaxID=2778070 RepID=UPI0019511FB3|nr:amidohydrolase family protein [Amycolatopsis sp. FDAARGOS 1241]QRP43665.1 amidohydrolase [Amycolatopsis sp. FDAARGOS 1241]